MVFCTLPRGRPLGGTAAEALFLPLARAPPFAWLACQETAPSWKYRESLSHSSPYRWFSFVKDFFRRDQEYGSLFRISRIQLETKQGLESAIAKQGRVCREASASGFQCRYRFGSRFAPRGAVQSELTNVSQRPYSRSQHRSGADLVCVDRRWARYLSRF